MIPLDGLQLDIRKRHFQSRRRFGLKSSGLLYAAKLGLKSTIGLK